MYIEEIVSGRLSFEQIHPVLGLLLIDKFETRLATEWSMTSAAKPAFTPGLPLGVTILPPLPAPPDPPDSNLRSMLLRPREDAANPVSAATSAGEGGEDHSDEAAEALEWIGPFRKKDWRVWLGMRLGLKYRLRRGGIRLTGMSISTFNRLIGKGYPQGLERHPNDKESRMVRFSRRSLDNRAPGLIEAQGLEKAAGAVAKATETGAKK
jgi:hypothetical protein